MTITVRASALLCLITVNLSVTSASAPITCNSGAMYGAGMTHPNMAYGTPGYYGGGYSGYPSYYYPQQNYQQQNYQQQVRPFYPSWPQSTYSLPGAYGANYGGQQQGMYPSHGTYGANYGGKQPATCGVGTGLGGYSGFSGNVTQGMAIGGQGSTSANLPPIGPISSPEIRCFKAMPPDGQLVPIAPGDVTRENALVAAQRAADLRKEIDATKASCLAKIEEEEKALKEAQITAGIAPSVPAPSAPVEPVKANVTYVDPNAV